MRAIDLIAGRTEEEREGMARMLGASSSEKEAILSAMRREDLFEKLKHRCDHELMCEDLVLLCANPFDPVLNEELVDPPVFSQVGLIEPSQQPGVWLVNLDMALSMAPQVPIEFGFSSTLVARLSGDDLSIIGRGVEIGPRSSRVQRVVDISSELVQPERVQMRLARLSESQRQVIREALAQGELPDGLDGIGPDSEVPNVTLAPGLAGQLGLVFMVEEPARGNAVRPVVPLELQSSLAEWLDTVPAAPEEATKLPPKKQPAARGSQRRDRASAAGVAEADSSDTGASTTSTTSSGRKRANTAPFDLPGLNTAPSPPQEVEVTHTRPARRAPRPQKMVRMVEGQPISGWVDLEEKRFVSEILRDKSLQEDIEEIIDDRFVVLRASAHLETWTERCAQRLQWEATSTGG